MKVYLINLDRCHDRRAVMVEQLGKLGIKFERISATDGRDVPAWLAPEFSNSAHLSAGEVGCYVSHLEAARRIVAEALPCAIVLEDDAILDPDFLETCRSAVLTAPGGWDYIHLCSVFKRTLIWVAGLVTGRDLVRYTRQPVNTAAYILSNAGARKWLAPMPRVRPNDIDNRYAWVQGLSVLGVHPAPARQDHEIEPTIDHQNRRLKEWDADMTMRLRGEWWTARQLGAGTYARARLMNGWNSLRRKIDGKRRVAIIRGSE